MSIHGQKNKIKIGVLGPGAVGGFVASLFWKNDYNVTCIGRDKTVSKINSDGIIFNSKMFGDFTAKPEAVAELDEELDLIFIAVKATALEDSIERLPLKYTENSIFLPLLNGIEHIEILKNKFGNKIVAGSISIEAARTQTAHVDHRSPFAIIRIGHSGDIPQNTIEKISGIMKDVGIEVYILKNEKEVLWGKLVRLNALACTTAAANKPIGWICKNAEWRKILEDCTKEGSLVAQKDGVDIKYENVMKRLDSLPEGLTTSMQRDVNAGNIPELDAIPGAIVKLGKKYNIECPTINKLINIIKEKL